MKEKGSAIRSFSKVLEILDKYGRSESKIIPILQDIQEEYRYLPQEVLTFVSTCLGISPAKLYGVSTFYSHFSLLPKGKHLLKMCDGTACHVRGSGSVINAVREKLELSEKKITTDDMMFTFECVSCLGACGLAPVMVINDEVYGSVTPGKALELIEEIERKEKENA